jgi:hypothetical protein
MGKPAAIKPMESPTGVAQIWVYHRQTQGSVRQVQVGMKYIPIAGDDQLLSTVAEPVFRQQTEMIDETISLLMFNKHFVMAKKSVSKHTEFD